MDDNTKLLSTAETDTKLLSTADEGENDITKLLSTAEGVDGISCYLLLMRVWMIYKVAIYC